MTRKLIDGLVNAPATESSAGNNVSATMAGMKHEFADYSGMSSRPQGSINIISTAVTTTSSILTAKPTIDDREAPSGK
ncbi:hypothetical protein LTR86_004550 [Recurvomyces mirabilis]|nr:hypothetical protein LTR86_004550 [Recurvomyces mirabilis]